MAAPTLRIDHGLHSTPPPRTRAHDENSESTSAPGAAPPPGCAFSRVSRYSNGMSETPSRTDESSSRSATT